HGIDGCEERAEPTALLLGVRPRRGARVILVLPSALRTLRPGGYRPSRDLTLDQRERRATDPGRLTGRPQSRHARALLRVHPDRRDEVALGARAERQREIQVRKQAVADREAVTGNARLRARTHSAAGIERRDGHRFDSPFT